MKAMAANETQHEHKLRWSNPYFERGGPATA